MEFWQILHGKNVSQYPVIIASFWPLPRKSSISNILHVYLPIEYLRDQFTQEVVVGQALFLQLFCRNNGIEERECILPFIYYDKLSTPYPLYSLRVLHDRCLNSIKAITSIHFFISKISSRCLRLSFSLFTMDSHRATAMLVFFYSLIPRNVPYGNTVP